MELVVTPEPGPEEREAVAVALERLLAVDDVPAAYRSGWRRAGILENLGGEDGPSTRPSSSLGFYATARPRSRPGATRA